MRGIVRRVRQEPALTYSLIQTAVALVVAFGLDLSGEQVGAITGFLAAGLGLAIRRRVAPLVKMPEREL